ncbi:hypothetical protein [Glaciihabitans sp. UYNi722]|uniref:hypothetical protein n=1 Tax=Glaciihabitans sp. UYNi722 TaxID=3156344 RepID=UPI00339887E9
MDTAMQEWIRNQDHERIGETLSQRFRQSAADGALITPETSASTLIDRLSRPNNGAIWDVNYTR